MMATDTNQRALRLAKATHAVAMVDRLCEETEEVRAACRAAEADVRRQLREASLG